MRLGVVVPKSSDDGFDLVSYHHVECFRLPRKFVSGSSQLTPEEFFEEIVDDVTEGDILPSKIQELAAKLGSAAAAAAGGSAKKKNTDTTTTTSIMGKLKQAFKDQENGNEKPAKKQKKLDTGESFEKLLELYREYHSLKADDLKDYLRWNRQPLTGHRDWVLFKVLDGALHGRLGFCGLCGGRLKLQEPDEDHVYCMGRFDEDSNIRLPCEFRGNRLTAQRLQPWFTEEPTDEEKEEMDKMAEEARGENGASAADNPEAKKLLKAAAKMDWNLTNRTGIQSATNELVALVEGKVDLPANKNPKMALGPMIVANKDKAPAEIVQIVIDKYGFAEQKEKKAAAKEAMLENMCGNPKNAALLMAFQELAQLYFKEGNRNAGAAYTKVVNAVKGMKQEITAENAMSFSKGKTKVQNIGKASAEKMKEFCQTGTIQKLEEKKAVNA